MDENPPGECSVGPTNNRSLIVNGSDLTLPAVPFNGCLPIVNFSVNLQDQIISPDGIYIMGDFQEAAIFSKLESRNYPTSRFKRRQDLRVKY